MPGWLACLLACFLVGCKSPNAASTSQIDSLHLLVTSVAVDLDKKPGPDGVGVRIYASRRGSADAVPITSGALGIMMFDGSLPADQLLSHKPLQTWSYSADTLKKHLQTTTIGASYRFAALWDALPKGPRVTILARYAAPDGKQIYSAPSSIPVGQ